MSEATINQRLKFLIERLSTSVRAFSEAIGDSYSNTQNYIGARQLAPKHEYIAKVVQHFSNVNSYWLLTGQGEPFLSPPTENEQPSAKDKKILHSQIVGNNNQNISNQHQATPTSKSDETFKTKLALAEKEIEHLRQLLAAKDQTIQILLNHQPKP